MNPPAMLDTLDDTGVLADFADALRVDPVEEMRLRTWARRNFVPVADRDDEWHSVVLDEMATIDGEAAA